MSSVAEKFLLCRLWVFFLSFLVDGFSFTDYFVFLNRGTAMEVCFS